MSVIDETRDGVCRASSRTGVNTRILADMAEALEDQVAGLYRRAATFEEEEFLLNREVEERETEINRLLLKLEAMRAERDRVMDRIESLTGEADAIKVEVLNRQGFEGIEREAARSTGPAFAPNDSLSDASFCRRMSLRV